LRYTPLRDRPIFAAWSLLPLDEVSSLDRGTFELIGRVRQWLVETHHELRRFDWNRAAARDRRGARRRPSVDHDRRTEADPHWVVLGLALAAALVRVMTTMLCGVDQHDPGTFTIVAGIMLLVGISATLVPAFRATCVDPIVTLRAE
jgi:hypothetical protein